jgi:hypothetical protein
VSERARRALTWTLGYLALTVLLLAPLSLNPATRLPDDGDAVQGVWIVWWGATHLGLGFPGVLDANVYYPHPRGLLYSEALLAQAVTAWPLYLLFDAVLATNLLMLLTLALSAAAFHLYARELVGSPAAAAVGAVAYVFCAYTYSQLPRLQLVTLQWMPLALWALHRHLGEGRRRWAGLFGAALALQVLACLYYAAFFAVALAVLLPLYAWSTGQWKRAATCVAAAALLAGPVAAVLGWEYTTLYRLYGFTGEAPSQDLTVFVRPTSPNLLYGPVTGEARAGVDYFLGYVVLLLGLSGVVSVARSERGPLRPLWWGVLGTGLLAILLAAGPELRLAGSPLGPGPFALLRGLPGFATLREPTRFVVLAQLMLALLAARGTAWILARHTPVRRRLLAALLGAVVALELRLPCPGVELPVGGRAPEAYRWLAGRPDAGPVVDLPVLPHNFIRFTSLEAYFSTLHGRPIPFGRFSFTPPALELLQWELRGFPDPRSLHLLRALGFRHAVVHPGRWEDPAQKRFSLRRLEERAEALPLLARFPDAGDAPSRAYHYGGERIHGITPGADDRAPLDCPCTPVPRTAFRVSGSGPGDPRLAVDGALATRWRAGDEQRRGDMFELVLDRRRTMARVEIEMAYPYGEFARHLELHAGIGDTVSRVRLRPDPAYLVALVRQLIERPQGARLRYDFEPVEADRLRLVLGADEYGIPGWTIPEIHLYGAAP